MFAVLDGVAQYAVTLAPVLMLLWFRYAFQAVVTLSLRLPVQGWQFFHTPNPGFQVLRGALLLIISACSFFGLKYLPIGELTAMMMLSPLASVALSAWLFNIKVALWRWVLLVLSLMGVLLIVRPGGQVFGWAIFFPLLLIVASACFHVLTSRLSGEENPYTTHFYTGLVGALLVGPFVLWSWRTQSLLDHWPWFVVIGFLGTFGHLMLIRAYQRASAPVLAPFLYVQIGFATLLGWLFFSHVPDAWAWLGIAVIVASGIINAVRSGQGLTLPKPVLAD
jgi:drug/metabolite transporter (DMT)-like permease